VEKLTVMEAHGEGTMSLPLGYDLEFDADMINLRGKDDAIAAAFGLAGTTTSETTKATWENYTRGRTPPERGR
jgi:hypothetical protein